MFEMQFVFFAGFELKFESRAALPAGCLRLHETGSLSCLLCNVRGRELEWQRVVLILNSTLNSFNSGIDSFYNSYETISS